jgi:hypothetical protein
MPHVENVLVFCVILLQGVIGPAVVPLAVLIMLLPSKAEAAMSPGRLCCHMFVVPYVEFQRSDPAGEAAVSQKFPIASYAESHERRFLSTLRPPSGLWPQGRSQS